MSFVGNRQLNPGGNNAEFTSGLEPQAGRAFETADGDVVHSPSRGGISSMGENRVAQAAVLRRNARERVFTGAPKFWRITNRATLGHVKVWMGVFDGEVYPEGATDDKRSWLQPGESMIVPMDAGLHFCGNIFHPQLPDAARIIETTGGFELETEATTPGRNAPLRIIGGPIGLPDFVIEPLDGRERVVGAPVALYEMYDKVTRKFWVRRKGRDEDVLAAERELLADRISEYTLDDAPLYDGAGTVVSTAASRAEKRDPDDEPEDDLPDMTEAPADEPVPSRRSRRS